MAKKRTDDIDSLDRVFLTLDYLGMGEHTSILDGGLPAWRAEKRPVTTDEDIVKLGSLSAHANEQIVVDAAWVNANLKKPGVMILDARAPKFYTGEEVGRMPRGGHIPNAKNIPFSTLVEDSSNKFKSAETLRALTRLKQGDGVAP